MSTARRHSRGVPGAGVAVDENGDGAYAFREGAEKY